ncbi:hypothetical protein MFIFM68171_03951 [Madurella fahalii]|uniref:Uncharacterized protein n=1 Tax=Madurella fahalii TaxID=1157608 RepID=A0ABQ0G7L9_9PEZI
MSQNSRRGFPMLLKSNLRTAQIGPRQVIGQLGDTTLTAAMALFPDFGSWLLRSVWGDSFADSPVLAVERLKSQPRPIQDADKDTLVGAILTMGSSLHLALHMLLELLPEDKSRERLGEVLCPTLGQLLASLQSTLSSFELNAPHQTTVAAQPAAVRTPKMTPDDSLSSGGSHRQLPEIAHETAGKDETPRATRTSPAECHTGSPLRKNQPQHTLQPRTERFPPLEDGSATHQLRIEIHERSGVALVKALQAEMRVQAAIRVAVESLEFAEGQLKLVKEINQLHGGTFDVLQKHFYEGYNRLLLRALELEKREFGLPDRGTVNPTAAALPPQQHTHTEILEPAAASPRQHRSISFQSTLPARGGTVAAAWTPATLATDPERRPLARRNTIQGIKQEGARTSRTRPPLKRRLSLAEELAMVGEEDSESGYQEETSEIASSESGGSDLESGNESQDMIARCDESEEYSTNAESLGEASDSESEKKNQFIGNMSMNTQDFLESHSNATMGSSPLRSRLPRLKPPT